MTNKENYDELQDELNKFDYNKYCNLSQKEKNNIGIQQFFQTLGALTGFSHIIDSSLPSENKTLQREINKRKQLLQNLKWNVIIH